MEDKQKQLIRILTNLIHKENELKENNEEFYTQPYESWIAIYEEKTGDTKSFLAKMWEDLINLQVEMELEGRFGTERKSVVAANIILLNIKTAKKKLDLAISRVLKEEPHELDLDKLGYNLPVMTQAREAYMILRLRPVIHDMVSEGIPFEVNLDNIGETSKKVMQELHKRSMSSLVEWS